MKRRLMAPLLAGTATTLVALLVHELGGRYLVSIDMVLAATRSDWVAILVAAMLIFSRLWLTFIVPMTCGALFASRLWRLVSGRTPTEDRLRSSV